MDYVCGSLGYMPNLQGLITQSDLMILMRLVAATVLGAAVGFERQRSGKVAGLRTHALVSLGAALFTVISIVAFTKFPSVNGTLGYDYHLVANIVVGIGFIGAGTILRKGERIQGTTTAASLWVVAAIGIASGFGFFKEAFATSILAYLVLSLLWLLERWMGERFLYPNVRKHLHMNDHETHHELPAE